MNSPIKIIIADDHSLFRKGLRAILGNFSHIEILGEADNGDDVIKLVKNKKPAIVLLDLVMPNSNGFETVEKIKSGFEDTRIIILSMYDSETHIIKAVEAGACGYLNKNASPEEIVLALESVSKNGFYFNDRTNKVMLKRMYQRKKLSPTFVGDTIDLNKNEIAVIKGISEELTSTEIGSRLFLSARTIDGIRLQLLQKTGVKNSIGLVLYAIRNGILEV
jgi:DNA-binding NarL/FixJ family response regulator